MMATTLIDRICDAERHGWKRDDLRRARVTMTATLLAGTTVAVFLAVFIEPTQMAYQITAACCATVLLWNAYALRRWGRVDGAAAVVALALVMLAFTAAWFGDGVFDGALIVCGLAATLCAPLLIGPRMTFVVPVVLNAGAIFIYVVGDRSGDVHSDAEQLTLLAFGTIFVAGLGASYEHARREALAERDNAFETLQEQREARAALVENVDAVIFSTTPDLRLIAGNSRFARWSAGTNMDEGYPVLELFRGSSRDLVEKALRRALAGEHFAFDHELELPSAKTPYELSFSPIRKADGTIRGATVAARDVSERWKVRQQIDTLHADLIRTAHVAGMAEVATGVLHNVGNVLNSVNASASIVLERLRGCPIGYVQKTAELLKKPPSELAAFLTQDPRGQLIPDYLMQLGTSLANENVAIEQEMEQLVAHLNQMKSVVARQQELGYPSGRTEVCALDEIVHDALRLHRYAFERHAITLACELPEIPPMISDRGGVLEILTNFLSNAEHAVRGRTADKRVELHARTEGDLLVIEVSDNGIGFTEDVQRQLFVFGYTTKPTGHGFGLATCAQLAKAMGGSVSGRSDGPGKGATFRLEIPFRRAMQEAA